MLLRVAAALAGFQDHLIKNMGKPIGLETVAAFSKMVEGVVSAVKEGD